MGADEAPAAILTGMRLNPSSASSAGRSAPLCGAGTGQPDAARPSPPGGLTVVELLALVLVIGGVVCFLLGLTDYVRKELKCAQCVRLLRLLDQALTRYQLAEHAFPAGRADADSRQCLRLLAGHPSSGSLLGRLSPTLRGDSPSGPVVVDPWLQPLRYITDRADPERFRANGSRPIFESAGPDRDFGDHDPAASLDNIATDEPI